MDTWKAVCLLVGGTFAAMIAMNIREAYAKAVEEEQRRNGTLPSRWTDAARWEKKGRDY